MISSFLDLFIFINASVGLTYIITKSSIFYSFREFFSVTDKDKGLRDKRLLLKAIKKYGDEQNYNHSNYIRDRQNPAYYYVFNIIYKIVTCPLCFGFWSGLITYLMLCWGWHPILFGFIASIDSYLVYLLVESLHQYFEEK